MGRGTQGPPCPRCKATDVYHPRNWVNPILDRWWCMACGALWDVKPELAEGRTTNDEWHQKHPAKPVA